MATKNNFKKQRKELKRQKDRKERNAKRLHTERSKVTVRHPKYSQEMIREYINKHGLSRAVADLKLRTDNTEFTNKEVMEMIKESIPPMIRLHAGIEVYDILVKEGKIEDSNLAKGVFGQFDASALSVARNVEAVIRFVEAGKKPEEYAELVDALCGDIEVIFSVLTPEVVELMEEHKEKLDEYQKEHTSEGSSMEDFMQQKHAERMERYVRAELLVAKAKLQEAQEKRDAKSKEAAPVAEAPVETEGAE